MLEGKIKKQQKKDVSAPVFVTLFYKAVIIEPHHHVCVYFPGRLNDSLISISG